MNVTGVEWRDQEPREGRPAPRARPRRRAVEDGDDIVELHGESPDEPADELDTIEWRKL